MGVVCGATQRNRVFMGLALLAGLLTIAAACGGGGEPKAAPTGTAGQSAQQSASSTATSTPTVVGKASSTPAPATPTPARTAGATATPAGATAAGTGTATAASPVVVGYDMDPTGNDATTLGNIDRCVEVSAGQQFEVDVFLDGIAVGDTLLGYGYNIGLPDGLGELVAQDHQLLLASAAGNDILDVSDTLPTSGNIDAVNVISLGASVDNPPYVRGVLGRYTIGVPVTAPPGIYALTLDEVVLARNIPPGGGMPVDQVWDGKFAPRYGLVAVDVSCDAAAATAN